MTIPVTKIPLWLDLKKEYVDDNFERMLDYFRKSMSLPANEDDTFYDQSRQLLTERVEDLLEEVSSVPLHRDDPDREMLRFHSRLLGAFVIIESRSQRRREAYVAMLIQLLLICPKYGDQLMETIGKVISCDEIIQPGFSFEHIIDFHPEVFISHLLSRAEFKATDRVSLLEGKGRAWLRADGLEISASGLSRSEEETRHLSRSLDTGVHCWLATQNADRLKAGDSSDLGKILEFVDTFSRLQEVPLKQDALKRLPTYAVGDETVVRVTSTYGAAIQVETESESYQKIKGKIFHTDPAIAYYYSNKFHTMVRVGDRLPVTVIDPERGLFSFKDQFVRFCTEDLREFMESGEPLLAKMVKVADTYALWLTARGVVVRTPVYSNYMQTELAWLKITMIGYGPLYGNVYAEIDPEEEDPDPDDPQYEFLDETIRKDCFHAFLEASVPEDSDGGQRKKRVGELDQVWLRLLIRSFYYHQRNLSNPVERARFLGNALAMSRLIGDVDSNTFLQFTTDYLQAVVRFALGDDIRGTHLEVSGGFEDSKQVRVRRAVIDVLKEYGNTESSAFLDSQIHSMQEEMPVVSQVARLVQAANAVSGTISSSSLNLLKREIIRSLSLEAGDEMNLEGEMAPYLGLEGQTVEFKTSAVYPPNSGMQPDPTVQMGNIVRGICAFLNSTTGGTLYIGVNDSGYVSGLENDMAFLGRTQMVKSFDGYARWIQDELMKRLGMEVMAYIHIDAAYNERVVVIKVDPHPYRVVEVDGKSYIRVERESREMSEKLKRELGAKKLTLDRNKVAILMNLYHAEFKHLRVKLHDYASAHSGKVKDRVVEPFKVMKEHGLIQAYDVDKGECKLFSLERIGYVEVLEEEWENEEFHKEVPVDAFHMTGPEPIEVSLQLDLLAKTLLVEEYPMTKNDIKGNPKDPNAWYYHGTLYSIEGLVRFYLGLAPHIKVTRAPQLQKRVKEAIAQIKL